LFPLCAVSNVFMKHKIRAILHCIECLLVIVSLLFKSWARSLTLHPVVPYGPSVDELEQGSDFCLPLGVILPSITAQTSSVKSFVNSAE
jgi:hypothetical protein